MSVSKQDWKDFHAGTWSEADSAGSAAVDAFDLLIAAANSNDGVKFLELTDPDNSDSVNALVNQAARVMSQSVGELEGLQLKGNQRRFANKNAIAASEDALSAVNQCNFAFNQIDTDQVRGWTMARDAVEEDGTGFDSVSSDVSSKASSVNYTLKACLEQATAAVADLSEISQIGMF
ncbi:MAG: hypothetical protein KGQ66_04770 [Acidobacteriota bacterium]|nr:hypothetical protein [Acidobacteriota bacterium]